ncbi:MAG: AAA family ATPase, partial [Planctomycetota bacterium]
MLTTLHLQNFRGFADHAVSFQRLSVVVGPNNGGKSTVIEALRLMAEVIDRIPHGRFGPAPEKFQRLGVTEPGVFMTPEQLGVRPSTLFHRYALPPAKITATFSSGIRLSLWMAGHDALLAVLSDHHGRSVSARSELRDVQLPQVRVLPQIRPLEDQETTLKGQYVLQCLNSHLASRHFRNQLRFLHEHFPPFVRLFEASWRNVRISAFDAPNSNHGDSLALMINEDGFVAEAADFG